MEAQVGSQQNPLLEKSHLARDLATEYKSVANSEAFSYGFLRYLAEISLLKISDGMLS